LQLESRCCEDEAAGKSDKNPVCIDADVRTLVLEGSNVGECADRVVQPNLEPVRFIVHVRGTLRPSGLSEVGPAVTAYGTF